jgi:hypothetical protein
MQYPTCFDFAWDLWISFMNGQLSGCIIQLSYFNDVIACQVEVFRSAFQYRYIAHLISRREIRFRKL